MEKILVIVPSYNERENIGKLLSALFALGRGLDVLVVDDGADGTDAVIAGMQAGRPGLFLIKRTSKAGRGSAVNEGLRWGLAGNYDYLCEMDADFSHDPRELPSLLERAAPDTVVIGSRYALGSKIVGWPLRRRVFSKLANIYANFVLGLGIHDYTNGFRVYPRQFAERLDFGALTARGFIALSEIAYEMSEMGAKFVEVPIRFVNRRRGASSFSLKEIKESFLSVLKIKFSFWEIAVLLVLAVSFFVGLAHGFPLTGVVGDEAPNVGGVVRALERHTLLPAAGDVPYATVTYLLSYVFIAAYLLAAAPFFGFHAAALKLHLLQNPHELYFVVRAGSALLGVAALLILHKLARRAGASARERVSIVLLVMTNMLTAGMFRTTKVWVLSSFLALLSVYFLYRALKSRAPRDVILSMLFAFLGFANFPFNFYAVAAAALALVAAFWKDKTFWPGFVKSLLLGAAVMAAVSALNWHNIADQAVTILSKDRALGAGLQLARVGAAFLVYLKRIVLLFPLLLLPLLGARGIRDRALFRIAVLYLAVFLTAISFTATWVNGTAMFLRYLTPLPFFLGLLLMSLRFRWSWLLPSAAGLSVIYYLFTLFYLTAPATYNQAYDYARHRLNDGLTVIVNDVSALQLPLNARSAAALAQDSCSSRCRETLKNDLNADFRPLVIDARRSRSAIPAGLKYYLFTNRPRADLKGDLAASFAALSDDEFFSVDHRLGTYFDWRYFTTRRFGENIYVYKIEFSTIPLLK